MTDLEKQREELVKQLDKTYKLADKIKRDIFELDQKIKAEWDKKKKK